MLFDSSFQDELLTLMALDTTTPMEGGAATDAASANAAFVDLARRVGMRVLFEGPGSMRGLADEQVPLAVTERLAVLPRFFDDQPHVVLETGQGGHERTLMFNFHIDTVGPQLPVRRDALVLWGRGAVDNKGPGVALLAALRALHALRPELLQRMRVLVQCVAGEEGGAMGVYGTRCLVQAGHTGRLNVFVEPTGGERYFDRSTCSMTYEVAFAGAGSTDDFPEQGDNATVALAFVAQHMAHLLAERAAMAGFKLTVAGLHTGETHNRVFGEGRLLFNLAYGSRAAAAATREAVESAFDAACGAFVAKFGALQPFARTATRLRQVCRSRWLKVGLPLLDNRDPAMEQLLATAGLHRSDNPQDSFTCDAIWGGIEGAYTIVYGPGLLSANGAHTDSEHVTLAELEHFTQALLRLMVAFGELGEGP